MGPYRTQAEVERNGPECDDCMVWRYRQGGSHTVSSSPPWINIGPISVIATEVVGVIRVGPLAHSTIFLKCGKHFHVQCPPDEIKKIVARTHGVYLECPEGHVGYPPYCYPMKEDGE